MPLMRATLVENAITAEQKQELIGRITHAVATVYTQKLRHSGDAAPLGRTARRASLARYRWHTWSRPSWCTCEPSIIRAASPSPWPPCRQAWSRSRWGEKWQPLVMLLGVAMLARTGRWDRFLAFLLELRRLRPLL